MHLLLKDALALVRFTLHLEFLPRAFDGKTVFSNFLGTQGHPRALLLKFKVVVKIIASNNFVLKANKLGYLNNSWNLVFSHRAKLGVAVHTLAEAHVVFDSGGLRAFDLFPESVLVPPTTRLRATGPFAEYSVVFAFFRPSFCLNQSRASLATQGGLTSNETSALQSSTTIIEVAPVRPLGHEAILRATENVASGSFLKKRADCTTVAALPDNGADLDLGTTTACFGASTVRPPLAHLAVNRARIVLAWQGLGQRTARFAPVFGGDRNLTSLSLNTITTSLGAGTKFRPRTSCTIDGARFHTANPGHLDVGTGLATVVGREKDPAVLVLNAATAALAAGLPFSPRAHFAVNGTVSNVAGSFLFQGRANGTAMASTYKQLALTDALATATALVTLGPFAPCADSAVNGAGTQKANSRFRFGTTSKATVGGLSPGAANAELSAR
jgi:hypothetical protein